MELDFTDPRAVCRRLAGLHIACLRRQAAIDALTQAQAEDDRERDRLNRLVLAMAADGTAVKVDDVPDPENRYVTTSVALVVDNRLVTCLELVPLNRLPDLDPEEVDAALESAAVDPRIAAEAALMEIAADEGTDELEFTREARGIAGSCRPVALAHALAP